MLVLGLLARQRWAPGLRVFERLNHLSKEEFSCARFLETAGQACVCAATEARPSSLKLSADARRIDTNQSIVSHMTVFLVPMTSRRLCQELNAGGHCKRLEGQWQWGQAKLCSRGSEPATSLIALLTPPAAGSNSAKRRGATEF